MTRPTAGKQQAFASGLVVGFNAGDECIDWPFPPSTGGYGKLGKRGAHVVVCELVHGPNPTVPEGPRMQVRHLCGRPICVNPRHLCWGTAGEDAEDRVRHGTTIFGESHQGSKLTEGDVRYIRASSETLAALAERFGVSRRLVLNVRQHKAWRHVTDDLPNHERNTTSDENGAGTQRQGAGETG